MADDPARARFMIINLLRVGGLAIFVFGLLVTQGRFGLPPAAGYVLMALGIADIFLAPLILARRWRTPPS